MVFNQASAKSCAQDGEQIEIAYGRQGSAQTSHLRASALLLAAGRRPNLEGLGLEKAGVQTTQRGIVTNVHLQTTQPQIYAAGDIVGPYQFTHMADYHARIVVRNILMPLPFLRQKVDYSVVPWCTFVDPEVARVGLSEKEARKGKIAVDMVRPDFAQVDRAIV